MRYKAVVKFGDKILELPHRFDSVAAAQLAIKEVADAIGEFIGETINTGDAHINAAVVGVDPPIYVTLRSPVKEEELTLEGFVEGEDEPGLTFTTPEGTFNKDIHPLEIKRYVDGLRKLYPNIEVEG